MLDSKMNWMTQKKVCIEPPAAEEESDEGSADGDNSLGGKKNILSGKQLQDAAKAVHQSGKGVCSQYDEDE